VRSQFQPDVIVTLTAAAPSGGAVVSVSSSHDVAKVPGSVTVPAGATTARASIDTSTVSSDVTVTISASYAGVSKTATFTVLPPLLEPRFVIASPSRGTDACQIEDVAGNLDCPFDAKSSSGFPSKYIWVLRMAGRELTLTQGSAVFTPGTSCSFWSGAQTNSENNLSVQVSLQLEDRSGTQSGTAQRTITVHTNGKCGF
jgi:hypothetical protein